MHGELLQTARFSRKNAKRERILFFKWRIDGFYACLKKIRTLIVVSER